MMKPFKNRVVLASALFGILDLIRGFVIASPILIYLRIIYENTDSSLRLWPLPSIDIVLDFLLNRNDVFIFYIITAIVLASVFFFIQSYFTGGIYRLLILERDHPDSIKSAGDLLKSSAEVWIGFIKVGLFALAVYGLAIFLGLVFGGFFGRFGSFLRIVILALFLLLASTYLQILKIHMASTSGNSLKAALGETRIMISGSFGRLFVGNLSVSLAAFIAVMIIWFILKAVKSADWNIFIMALAIIIQQVMIFTVCLGQSIRINFNYSVIKKGAESALGGDELG
jgi:hypothetical protein